MSIREWNRARDLSRFYTSDGFDQQALQFLYSSIVNGRTLKDLCEFELEKLIRLNGLWESRGGQQIYVNSFGTTPVVFCAPYTIPLSQANGETTYSDPYSLKFVLALASSCGATAIFPVCRINHPGYIDRHEYQNPLVAAISRVIEKMRILLYIEVFSASWRMLPGLFETSEYSTLGWPDFDTEFSPFVQPLHSLHTMYTKLSDEDVYARENLFKPLFLTMVRKQLAIPSVALHLAQWNINGSEWVDSKGNWQRRDEFERYTWLLGKAKTIIPDVAAYVQFERQRTGVAALNRLYRTQYSTKDTQPLLPAVAGTGALALPPGSEPGVVEAASITDVLEGLYARYGGGQ